MDMFLKDKVVIVTGAGSGIGAATAKTFAEEGAKVVVADYVEESAQSVAAEIGSNARPFTVDVRKAADARAMAEFTVTTFGGIDVLVNNAGRGMFGTVENAEEDDWNDIVAVSLNGTYLCSKFAIPEMRKRGGGAIVNTASNIAMAMAIKDRAAYVAAKGAVSALTRSMALDFAADNIRVNSVAPGVIWSNYFDKMLSEVDDPEAFKEGLRARAPTHRWGTPQEIANAIVWLASERASYATGSMMTVDGGSSVW
ncbi:SDR family oxidoreductase [Acuticoccus sp. M5D2P5]|uniref:SDR family oxidoreductase n=1 Tax=Acuticoccus kalidii TaxID=2910977 RepID=UPI001F16E401|nr:SDR family oxidoreductase [Acuticoccus kalidii]MCF3934803.1 SDR family oxidoreductase [Acuticoccus kalidii]